MQIKIVQTEIEEAIRNHIQSQIMVRDGMQISIDLSATRGPEGFIATIDISPAAQQGSPQVTGTTTQRVETTVAPSPAPTPAPVVPRKQQAVRQAAAIPRPSSEPATTIETVGDNPEAETMAAAEEDAKALDTATQETAESLSQPQAPTTAPTGRSLFGGLSTPKNS